MSFSQSTITDLQLARSGADLLVRWTSTSPAGTTFQVYIDRVLAWHGVAPSAKVSWPAKAVKVDVGTVAPGEGAADFSSSLPSAPDDRAALSWLGGTYLKSSIAGYQIFSSTAPGGAVSYAKPVALVPAYDGAATDGWGLGGWSQGGWGEAASAHSWTSGPLANGVWNFAVAAVDSAGNPAPSPATTAVTIAAPPNPPAPFPGGKRLNYTLNPSTHVATLAWNASP